MASASIHVSLCAGDPLVMINLFKYREIVWFDGGRDFPYLDCYGLVLEFRKDLGLPTWPDYRGVTKHRNQFDQEAREFIRTRRKTEPESGAMGLVTRAGVINHAVVCFEFAGLLYVAECNPVSNMTISTVSDFMRKNKNTEWWI